jgi:putative membrane protein
MGESLPHHRYLLLLAVLFLAWFTVLAIEPLYRHDWALENVLVLVSAVGLGLTYKRFTFSRVSYTLIFLFLCLHQVGAHYTYAEVPYDQWFETLTGRSFNELVGWERNNFDRIVHFLYGLLLAYPIREIYLRIAGVSGFWGYFLPFNLTMSTSLIYELLEWGTAEVVGGDLGMAYLGIQGDVWDAHKDMLLAGAGALAAMTVTALLNIYLQRDFAREWVESLRVKGSAPLGEDEIERLWRARHKRQP